MAIQSTGSNIFLGIKFTLSKQIKRLCYPHEHEINVKMNKYLQSGVVGSLYMKRLSYFYGFISYITYKQNTFSLDFT